MALVRGWYPTGEQKPEHTLGGHLFASWRGRENLLTVRDGETVKTNALDHEEVIIRAEQIEWHHQLRWGQGLMLPRAWPSGLSCHQ